ncbi:MAG: hypothetical protein RIR00_1955 [Pseudomonadota bacterium]
MRQDNYRIRTMRREEIDLAVEWAAAEGWNPGLFDADSFYAADPQGFLLGELDGQPIASISVVRYGGDFGFLGFYIVKPGHRGQGYGYRLWQAGLQHLAGRNIGLDGVVAQQDNYRRSGFQLAYRNIRYAGQGGQAVAADADIVPVASLPMADVLAYDRACFPAERDNFLRHWLAQPQARALAILDQGRLAGYGMLRPCRQGHKLGPLFADTPALAERLFLGLQAGAPAGGEIFLDVPEPHPAAITLAERHGMHKVFETARMYTGPFPQLPLHRLYGVTSFELG